MELDLESLVNSLASALTAKRKLPSNTLSTGVFHTTLIRSSDKSSHNDETTVQLERNSDAPSIVLLGLNLLNFGKGTNMRIKAEVVDKSRDSFRIALNSYSDTIHHASGCSWLRVNYDDPDIQFGHFSTIDDHPWYEPQDKTTRRITFARPYTAPPNVVLWFTMLDIDHNNNNHCRAHTFATDITTEGFNLNITTWGGTKLYIARAAWFAHPAGRPDICSGHFGTHYMRRQDKLQSETSETISFDAGFSRPPKVFVALKLINISNFADFRVKVNCSNVTAAGLTWHIDTWGSSQLPQASGSFIAFDNDTV